MPLFLVQLVGWLLRGPIIKFIIFFTLAALLALLIGVVEALIGGYIDGNALTNAFGMLPASVLYFVFLFKIPSGVALIVAAYVTRFMIRRLPFVG